MTNGCNVVVVVVVCVSVKKSGRDEVRSVRSELTQVAEATVKPRRADAASVQAVAVSVVGTAALSSAVPPKVAPGTSCGHGGGEDRVCFPLWKV